MYTQCTVLASPKFPVRPCMLSAGTAVRRNVPGIRVIPVTRHDPIKPKSNVLRASPHRGPEKRGMGSPWKDTMPGRADARVLLSWHFPPNIHNSHFSIR